MGNKLMGDDVPLWQKPGGVRWIINLSFQTNTAGNSQDHVNRYRKEPTSSGSGLQFALQLLVPQIIQKLQFADFPKRGKPINMQEVFTYT